MSQEYEKELKKAKATLTVRNAQKKTPPQPAVNMLESSYSRTFIFASNSSKKINVKEVSVWTVIRKKAKTKMLQENGLIDVFSLGRSELEDFLEDDRHPVSSTDPMLSSPAPSTLSSSPSSLYSSDENLSPQAMDHMV